MIYVKTTIHLRVFETCKDTQRAFDCLRVRNNLQVAHNLDSVLECDRVVVLDAGHVAEQGSPGDLLRDASSNFFRMHHASAHGHDSSRDWT